MNLHISNLCPIFLPPGPGSLGQALPGPVTVVPSSSLPPGCSHCRRRLRTVYYWATAGLVA
eukprot:766424-Hanusia_phi.AAC.2